MCLQHLTLHLDGGFSNIIHIQIFPLQIMLNDTRKTKSFFQVYMHTFLLKHMKIIIYDLNIFQDEVKDTRCF